MLTTMYINMIRSFFSNLLFLLFHFGCFTFSSHHRHGSSSHFKKGTLISSIKRFFSSSSSSSSSCNIPYQPPLPSMPSPSSSTRSLRVGEDAVAATTTKDGVIVPNIRPCSVCSEIFQSSTLLQHHHATKHAISELIDGENIVRIIFNTGWPDKAKSPTIHRILKIHNTPKTVARFEEYRERVKSRAEAAAAAKIKALSWNERCIADGNELLRFYCTTFICSSLQEESTTCNQQYCSACGIIINGFSQKMDGISTLPTSWRAHTAIPEDLEDEFSFMHVKRALLVCRVIAGRVGCDPDDPGFDSLMGSRNGVFEDELLVFSPRAVLPCFVIVYTV